MHERFMLQHEKLDSFFLVLAASFHAGYTHYMCGAERAYIAFFLISSVLSAFSTLFTWTIWLFTKRQRGGFTVMLCFLLFSESTKNPCQEQRDCIPQGVHQGRFGMGSAQWLLCVAVNLQAREH